MGGRDKDNSGLKGDCLDEKSYSGKPLKVILHFALPLYIGQLFQLAYSLFDTRIIGSTLGDTSLAAVGATTSLCDLLIEFMNGVAGRGAHGAAQCGMSDLPAADTSFSQCTAGAKARSLRLYQHYHSRPHRSYAI